MFKYAYLFSYKGVDLALALMNDLLVRTSYNAQQIFDHGLSKFMSRIYTIIHKQVAFSVFAKGATCFLPTLSA